MNFFEHQDRARRYTGRLVLLMILAVASLIALTIGVLMLALEYGNLHIRPTRELILYVAAAVIGVVLLGSLFKQAQLAGGGAAVAERLGGRLLNLGANSFEDQRLLNVVEEMAIASGLPVPAVYVLEEPGINAFAAGTTPENAVIGITRGAIQALNREELQGVIAHEFSHIFNGDMRLNIRLVAVLHGILMIGLIGQTLMRSLSELPSSSRRRDASSSSNSSSSSSGGNAIALVMLVGFALMLLGYVGTFFGNLIKAAVSRQREYLADASAVQFTRNPSSIAGALKKIGAKAEGSELRSAHANEFSHLFFASGIYRPLSGLTSTHPSLEARIRRIEPDWDGEFPRFSPAYLVSGADGVYPRPKPPASAAAAVAPASYATAALSQSIDAIGDPGDAHLQTAQRRLDALPRALKRAAHSTVGAQALLYGLLLQRDEAVLKRQLDGLREGAEPAVLGVLESLRESLAPLAPELRLPLLDLAIPALKQLAREEVIRFKGNLLRLIQADGKVALMEWTLLRIVERNIEPPRRSSGRLRLAECHEDVSELLSALAQLGPPDGAQRQAAFAAACAPLALKDATLRPARASRNLDLTLKRLAELRPQEKPKLLAAMAVCVTHDGHVAAAEAELVRAVADTLGCPMPVLLG